jgi:sugar lactone lactonase YvrE
MAAPLSRAEPLDRGFDPLEPVIHVEGLGFPEDPVALPDGAIAFVDLLDQKIRLCRDGAVWEVCTLKGSPNGMRLGPEGALYVANKRRPLAAKGEVVEPQISGRLQRVTEEGVDSDVAVNLPGEAPCRPNDLVFTALGDIVFTDPQNWEDIARARAGLSYTPYCAASCCWCAPTAT